MKAMLIKTIVHNEVDYHIYESVGNDATGLVFIYTNVENIKNRYLLVSEDMEVLMEVSKGSVYEGRAVILNEAIKYLNLKTRVY